MKKEFQNFIKSLKEIKLSEKERAILHSKISEFISWNPIREKAYIPGTRNYLSIFEVRNFVKATAFILILGIVAGGSSVSYAASDALPGEKLYNVKVNINEKIEESLAFTTEAKVSVESKQVERRLEETQTLVKENKLSEDTKKIVEDKLDEHIEDLTKDINTLKENGEVEIVLETTAKLAPVLEVHKDILTKKDIETTDSLIAKVEDTIQKVEKEENDILATVIDTDKNVQNDQVMMTMEMEVGTSETDLVESKEDITEKKAVKEVEDEIDELNEEIKDLVDTRIEKAQEKIKEIKKDIETEKVLNENIVPEKNVVASITPTIINTPKDGFIIDETKKDLQVSPSLEINNEQKTVLETTVNKLETAETKIEQTEVILKESEMNIVLPEIESSPKSDLLINLENKLKEAEDILKEAKDAFQNGNYKQALSLTQKVLKIAGEIEIEKKLKVMELSSATNETSTQTAEVIKTLN